MGNEISTEAAPAARAKGSDDLSSAIDEAMERERGEEIRSVRVYGDYYRCNWWVRDGEAGPMYLNTGRIIKSKFVRATMSNDQLQIEDMSYTRPRD